MLCFAPTILGIQHDRESSQEEDYEQR
jgi:hypothetical protein